MKVAEALRLAADRLSATSDTARLDAELLMAHALNVSRSDMLLGRMRAPTPEGFEPLVERRSREEPVAHIVGHQEFYGLDLLVTPDTLIPRGDSETLIETARDYFSERAAPRRICDLGTGTGALLLAALSVWGEAEGIAIDASEPALAVARDNAARLGMGGRAQFHCRSWRDREALEELGTFDLVLCNPPYIESDAQLDRSVREYEPGSALFAGPDGLDDYRSLLPKIGKLKTQDGVAIFEIGHRQGESVAAIATASGLQSELRRDLAGRPRALILV